MENFQLTPHRQLNTPRFNRAKTPFVNANSKQEKAWAVVLAHAFSTRIVKSVLHHTIISEDIDCIYMNLTPFFYKINDVVHLKLKTVSVYVK